MLSTTTASRMYHSSTLWIHGTRIQKSLSKLRSVCLKRASIIQRLWILGLGGKGPNPTPKVTKTRPLSRVSFEIKVFLDSLPEFHCSHNCQRLVWHVRCELVSSLVSKLFSVFRDAWIITLADFVVSCLGAVVIFSVTGFMAHYFHQPVSADLTSSGEPSETLEKPFPRKRQLEIPFAWCLKNSSQTPEIAHCRPHFQWLPKISTLNLLCMVSQECPLWSRPWITVIVVLATKTQSGFASSKGASCNCFALFVPFSVLS